LYVRIWAKNRGCLGGGYGQETVSAEHIGQVVGMKMTLYGIGRKYWMDKKAVPPFFLVEGYFCRLNSSPPGTPPINIGRVECAGNPISIFLVKCIQIFTQ